MQARAVAASVTEQPDSGAGSSSPRRKTYSLSRERLKSFWISLWTVSMAMKSRRSMWFCVLVALVMDRPKPSGAG